MIAAVILISCQLLYVGAQETKGVTSLGQSSFIVKGGSSSRSQFKENVAAFKQKLVRQRQKTFIPEFQRPSKIDQENVFEAFEPRSQQQKLFDAAFKQIANEELTDQQEEDVDDQRPVDLIHGLVERRPGVDFPAYTSVPNTGFTCDGVPFEPGMYADEKAGCQAYHLCYDGRRESFLCGTGTLFSQSILACDFWHQVNCSKTPSYYQSNAGFGKAAPVRPQPVAVLKNKSLISSKFNVAQANSVGSTVRAAKTSDIRGTKATGYLSPSQQVKLMMGRAANANRRLSGEQATSQKLDGIKSEMKQSASSSVWRPYSKSKASTASTSTNTSSTSAAPAADLEPTFSSGQPPINSTTTVSAVGYSSTPQPSTVSSGPSTEPATMNGFTPSTSTRLVDREAAEEVDASEASGKAEARSTGFSSVEYAQER